MYEPNRPLLPNANTTSKDSDLRIKWITEPAEYTSASATATATASSSWDESHTTHLPNDATQPSSVFEDDMPRQANNGTLKRYAASATQDACSPALQQSALPAFRASKSTRVSHGHQTYPGLTHRWTFEEQITVSMLDALSVRPFKLKQAMQGRIAQGGGRWCRFWNQRKWNVKSQRDST